MHIRRTRGSPAHGRHRTVAVGLAMLVGALLGAGHAQVFNADRYLQECLRFEAGGDHTTARQSCLNSLQVDPDNVQAELALARIELALGEHAAAESRLYRIRNRVEGPEPLVLLAEVAFLGGRRSEAAAFAANARSQLDRDVNLELSARIAYLEAEIAARDGRFDDALHAYERAIDLDGLEVRYRLADARLRFRLGDVDGALSSLERYATISGDARNADLTSLEGRLLWAKGSMGLATDRIETALALRSLRDSSGQSDDLRVLSLLYYAQGDLESGGLALREAMRRGNLLASLGSNAMLWLVAVVVLLAVHLLGESRHSGGSAAAGPLTAPPPDGAMLSVGQAYGVFLASALMGLAASLVYSALVYQNLLALFTPLQQQEARAVYFAVFALVAAALTWQRARQAGIDPAERLLGSPNDLATGLVIGLGVVALVVGYLAWTERGGMFGSFFLDLSRPTVFAIVALALLPLSELFFRGFYYPSLAKRYGTGLAVVASALIFAIAFGTPILLLVLVGLVLGEVYRRRKNGLLVLSAVLVGWVGLVIAAGLSPFVRSLFFA